MPKLSINLADDFKAGESVSWRANNPAPADILSKRALFWLGVILVSGCALVAITGADKAHGADMHVNKPKPLPVAPYCGTANGIAVSDDASACAIDPEYPAPRFTNHGWNCPTQYHLAGRKGALRCDEET